MRRFIVWVVVGVIIGFAATAFGGFILRLLLIV